MANEPCGLSFSELMMCLEGHRLFRGRAFGSLCPAEQKYVDSYDDLIKEDIRITREKNEKILDDILRGLKND